MTTMPTEAEGAAYLAGLYELEQDPGNPRMEFSMGPFTGFAMIAALQLALRHPAMSEVNASLLRQLVDQVKPMFSGTLGEVILAAGDDPAYDQAARYEPAEIDDCEQTTTRVEVKHPVIYDGWRVLLAVGAHTSRSAQTWLTPEQADHLVAHLRLAAAHARRLDAEYAEMDRRAAEARQILSGPQAGDSA